MRRTSSPLLENTLHLKIPTLRGIYISSKVCPTLKIRKSLECMDNANITFQLKESSDLVDNVILLEPRAGGGSNSAAVSPDEFVQSLAEQMRNELPERLDIESEAGPTTFVINQSTNLHDPLATFLMQEIVKFNNLIEKIGSTLDELGNAIRGFVVMSSDLDKMFMSFLINRVPELWARAAYPSLFPLAQWWEDLRVRVAFLRKWLHSGEPVVFPMSVFFFPQGFMTGVLQTHARKHLVAVNSLTFDFQVYPCHEDDIDERPTNGVVVAGLYMEGATWDPENHCIKDAAPGQIFSYMRPIHFLPAEDFTPDLEMYACPVYKTSTRAGALSTTGMSTNFVLPIYLPCDCPPEHWTWRGVAFVTQPI